MLVAALGCEESAGNLVFDVRIVDRTGGNPALDTDAEALSITVQQAPTEPRTFEFAVVDGVFDAGVFIESISVSTKARIALTGPTTQLIGAPPPFVPAETLGTMTIVVGEPSTCGRLEGPRLATGRANLGASLFETFAFIAGGSENDPQVEFFDLLRQELGVFEVDLDQLGSAQVAAIADGQSLVVSMEAAPFIFNLADDDNRIVPVTLHDGAGPASALVTVVGQGTYVIGGDDGGAATSSVSVVDADGGVVERTLSVVREGAAVAGFGEHVLVVGGDATGSAELLSPTGETTPIEGFTDGVRSFGLLIANLAGDEALLIGGLDATDELRSDTVLFTGCPQSCVASVGPSWTESRAGTVTTVGSQLLIGGEGSRLVQEVRFTDGAVSIASVGELTVARSRAAATLLESGVLIVIGGHDGVAARDDIEICFPAELVEL